MKKKFLIITTLVFYTICAFAQTITNVKVSHDKFCPGSKINVMFQTAGTFQNSNTYVAQLSDERGNFSSFTNIGSTSTGSNSIAALIPDRPQSTRYKIRVVSSLPYTIALDNSISLTLQSNPQPTFTIQPEGKNVQYSNTVLLGGNVIFTNTTSGMGECEWNFGDGASISSFKGCSPPPISYSTTGQKTPSLKIIDSGCSGETILDSYSFKIVSCNPKIPSSVQVVRTGKESDGPNSEILVCPGAVYQTNMLSGKEVYVETGGTFILNYIGGSTAYATKGGEVSIINNYGAVIYEESASVTGNPQIKLLCPSVTFDYSQVQCKCNEDCNFTNITEPIAANSLSFFPNPSQRNIVINGVEEEFSMAIYNAHGILILQEAFSKKEINLNLIPGMYMVKVTDSKGLRMEKLIISK